MPAVNLPVQGAHNIISPGRISLSQAQLILALAAALLGPILLLTLAITCGRRYKTSSRLALVEKQDVATEKDPYCLPKQSRETRIGRVIMSASRHSESPPFQSQGIDEEGSFGNKSSPSPSRSRRHSGRRRQHHKQRDVTKTEMDESRTYFKGRPPQPQPLPLTPPGVSTTFYSFQDRRLSTAASSNGDFERSIVYRSNSDSNTSESTASMAPPSQGSSPIFLQRSYANLLPLDPLQPGTSMKREEMEDHHSSAFSFSPSSFPSSNPILPMAPHDSLEPRDMDVTGDMMSLHLDDDDAIWKRHTRVYGGGVCLACMAAGGGDDGGYYGENVPLDQRR